MALVAEMRLALVLKCGGGSALMARFYFVWELGGVDIDTIISSIYGILNFSAQSIM
jgi:hypothetical protein